MVPDVGPDLAPEHPVGPAGVEQPAQADDRQHQHANANHDPEGEEDDGGRRTLIGRKVLEALGDAVELMSQAPLLHEPAMADPLFLGLGLLQHRLRRRQGRLGGFEGVLLVLIVHAGQQLAPHH
jgi:hypothetical protein